MIRSYGSAISDFGMICEGYSNWCTQNFQTFQAVSSTRVCVKVYEGDKIGAQTGIFVHKTLSNIHIHIVGAPSCQLGHTIDS